MRCPNEVPNKWYINAHKITATEPTMVNCSSDMRSPKTWNISIGKVPNGYRITSVFDMRCAMLVSTRPAPIVEMIGANSDAPERRNGLIATQSTATLNRPDVSAAISRATGNGKPSRVTQ